MDKCVVWTPSKDQPTPPGNPFVKRVSPKTSFQSSDPLVPMPEEFKKTYKSLVSKWTMPQDQTTFPKRYMLKGAADEEWFKKYGNVLPG